MLRHSKTKLEIYSLAAIFIVFIYAVYIYNNYQNEDLNDIKARDAVDELIDYNNYKYLVQQMHRTGIGEQGEAVFLEDPQEIERNQQLYERTGFYVLVSDKISVNRSIPDLRSSECRTQKYSSKLPKVSVIIIFHNEPLSILKRTVHSVWNRSPPSLLHEIILVNDASTESELYDDLRKYANKNFGSKVRIKNLPKRKGLIRTRMEGARIARGEILMFLDAHVEVGYGFLPPLIAPIKQNRRLATVPIIDDFDSKTFKYHGMQPSRGIIDWMWIFHEIRVELEDPITPFSTPIMLGCAFAIDRKFFLYELHGYDEQLDIWNGENYELSFKLHLCAEGLFKVPCSRVAHTFRDHNPTRTWKYDYVAKNFKRVAEVWLDEYKDILYSRDPEKFADVNAGDLSLAKKVHKELNCKPFKYFLNVVARDMSVRYPPLFQVPVFASGTLKSSINGSELCLLGANVIFVDLMLYNCHENSVEPTQLEYFSLTFHKQISLKNTELCLDSAMRSLIDCHYEGGNQQFSYSEKTRQIINSNNNKMLCLTAYHANKTINFEECDNLNGFQRWEFGYTNLTALQRWDEINGYENM